MLPTDSKDRKDIPLARGCMDYFPDALAAIAELSKFGNDKHNPGRPLHWSKEKSSDHADCVARHLLERGKFITGEYQKPVRHSTAMAWRALALLQTEIENEVAIAQAAGGKAVEWTHREHDWHENVTGKMPVHGDELVDVKLRRGGSYFAMKADCWGWRLALNGSDIVSWRRSPATTAYREAVHDDAEAA